MLISKRNLLRSGFIQVYRKSCAGLKIEEINTTPWWVLKFRRNTMLEEEILETINENGYRTNKKIKWVDKVNVTSIFVSEIEIEHNSEYNTTYIIVFANKKKFFIENRLEDFSLFRIEGDYMKELIERMDSYEKYIKSLCPEEEVFINARLIKSATKA